MMRTAQIGCCTLVLADYQAILPKLQDVSAIIADPPYGNDYRQKRSRDKLVKVDAVHAPIVGNAQAFDPSPLLAVAPTVILWGANYYANKLPANGKWLVWDKREQTTPDDGADLEMAWTNLKGVPRMHRQLWRGICRRGEENVSRGARKLHPNQKPVALMDWCLDQAGLQPGAHVVDTHMGSGTTGLACLRRGIRFTGIEIDPVHFETAVSRLQTAQHAAMAAAQEGGNAATGKDGAE
ncbi:DNA methyltransferase [Comamonas odontotermitis]|uniref:DNA methyltransferase n=1 Tax=Comamonas odontotermitis TaxID=379895 RepID=UPI00366ABE19